MCQEHDVERRRAGEQVVVERGVVEIGNGRFDRGASHAKIVGHGCEPFGVPCHEEQRSAAPGVEPRHLLPDRRRRPQDEDALHPAHHATGRVTIGTCSR